MAGVLIGAWAGTGCRSGVPSTPTSATATVCSSTTKLRGQVDPANEAPVDTATVSKADHQLLAELGPLSLGGPGSVAQQQIGEDANALTRELAAITAGRGDGPAAADTIAKIQRECSAVRH